jgi:NAD(P)-dependent dehydrogenase (short-subunit alcohol dehydrogenase family)
MKSAIVTGASRGIGLAIVEALLAKGWRVAGWSRSAPELRHPAFTFFPVDMADWEAVQEAHQATVAAFGAAPTVLVNNAGIAFNGPLADMDVARWYAMYEVNVHGVFHGCKAAIPAMKRAGGGHIVNIASLAGKTGTEGLAGYCGTKFAVRGLSEALFKELRYDGIKVTCINPGSVDTDLIKGLGLAGNPLVPADVADAVMFCLESKGNCLPSEIDLRPLKPKG